jgi:hypothetical protein
MSIEKKYIIWHIIIQFDPTIGSWAYIHAPKPMGSDVKNKGFSIYKPGTKTCRILVVEINKDLLNSFSKNKDSYSCSMHARNNKKCIQNFVEKHEA